MRDSAARVIATGTVCVTPDASFVPRHLSTRGAQCCAEAAPTIGKEGRAGKRSNTASATAQSARAQQQHNKNPMKRETGLDCACRAGRHRATGGRCNQPRRHGRGLQRRQGGGVADTISHRLSQSLGLPTRTCRRGLFSIQNRAAGAAKTNPQRPPPSSVRETGRLFLFSFLGQKTHRAQGPVPTTQKHPALSA